MPVEIKVPSVGESITEGTLSRWLKKDGDTVQEGDPLYELETEKATTEVPATAAGVLRIAVQEGKTVAIGSVVGRIEASASAKAKPAKKSDQPEATAGGKSAAQAVTEPVKKAAPAPARQPVPAPGSPPPPRVAAVAEDGKSPALSPAARRLAEEAGIDVAPLKGTGRDGRVTKEDVQHQIEAQTDTNGPAKPPAPPVAEGETRQRMSSIRQRIAERLVQAQNTTATLTTFNEADLSAVLSLRERHKERFQEKHGVRLGFMSFFVKAVVEALRAYPVVNSRIDGADIITCHYYNIGVAVSTERGLLVPVLRDADRLSFAAIEKTLAELAQKARDGKIAVTDLQGGTFTITNGGVFGSLLSTPILNPPQSAILGMHTIQKRPVAVNDQVVIRPMMYLALSYDHRLIDGREAVQFLLRIKDCIEDPERLLLEV
jgi:2-oxoglutarate dehydrogenase E2 component (dihydrolipoamide succinyltransferase)